MLEQLKNTDFLGPFVGKTVVDIFYEENRHHNTVGPSVKVVFDDDTWIAFCLSTGEIARCLASQG